MKKGSV